MPNFFVHSAHIAAVSAGFVMLSCVARAQPVLYVAQYKFQQADMRSMALDGTNHQFLFAMSAARWLPIGLKFRPATGRLVWMDSAGSSAVMGANTNGTSLTQSPTIPGFCKGVSLDAQGRVYFGSNNRVMRINADGTGIETLFTSPTTSNPVGAPTVDATNGHVYFGDDGFIRRMRLDGSQVKTVVSGISQARNVALDIAAGYIYWCDADTISDYIGRARLDGTEFTVLIDNSPSVVQSSGLLDLIVAPGLDRIIYADDIADRVSTARLDGSNNSVIFTAANDQSPSGIALSNGDPSQVLLDMNGNGIQDDLDIAAGAPDCDNNGILDSYQSSPCPQRTLLLDHGTRPELSTGKAVGELSVWEVFQPFDVPAGGWNIGQVGIDGFTANYHDGSGFIARIYRDDGTGERPNESIAEASAWGNFRFNINYANWVYLSLPVSLEPGRYWVQVASREPAPYPNTYHGVVNLGSTGLPSISRGSSGNFSSPGSPIALRLVQGPPISCADFNRDGFVDIFDYDDFVSCFEGVSCPPGQNSDFNRDGFADGFDYNDFVLAFEEGC